MVLAPGFWLAQGYYTWLAERVASHGLVVFIKRFVDDDRRCTPSTRGSSPESSRDESHGSWWQLP
ncbi:MAG: hypothetical protein KGL90_04820 [Burkholderiales bacterium]|nr:hypothetical protein [Burkholderiales bacterium]